MIEPENTPATTTLEEDKHTSSARSINMIWEFTQALIAMGVTAATLYMSIHGMVVEALGNAFFLVIGFYFGRTNHARTGGTGKPE